MREKGEPGFKKPIALLMVGLFFCLGPVFGMAGTVLGMIRAFETLGGNAEADADTLASHVNVALASTIIGWALTPMGALFVVLATAWIVKLHKRANQAPAEPAP